MLVAFALVGLLIGVFVAPSKSDKSPTSYRATTSMLFAGDTAKSSATTGSVRFDQVPVYVRIGDVPVAVAKKLGRSDDPVLLGQSMRVTSDAKTGLIEITATAATAADATALSDTFASETVAYLVRRQEEVRTARLNGLLARVSTTEQELKRAETALAPKPNDAELKAQRDAASRQYALAYDEYQTALAQPADTGLSILQSATASKVTSGGLKVPTSRPARALLTMLVATLIAFGVILVVERLDNRLRDRRRAEEVFELPVIVEVPTFPRALQRTDELIVGSDASAHLAEVYRTLRTSLVFLAGARDGSGEQQQLGVIVVTSPSPAEGKTSTAANLAAAFAETGRSVLVVNADFRRPRIGRFFLRAGQPMGFAGPRTSPTYGADGAVLATKVMGVRMLDLAGQQATPGELARETARHIAALRSQFDVVIIDTPPLSVTAEALEFIPDASAVLIMARLGRTSVSAAERAAELVRYGGASNVAVGLSDTGAHNSKRYRRYGYYYYRGGEKGRKGWPRRSTRTQPVQKPLADVFAQLDSF